jgi:ABC-2 type transport system permease protein
MTALAKLTVVETKLLVRSLAWLFTIGIPVFNMLVFGLPLRLARSGGDLTPIAATSLAAALALVALYMVPTTLASYRERGLLRRLSTTPLPPSTLLAVQLLVQSAMSVLTTVLLIFVAYLMLGVPAPLHLAGFVLVFVLGVSSLFAVGLIIAAIAPSGLAANGLGVLLFFPLAFLAGLLLPKDLMPPALARLGEFTPLGAFRQAMQSTWTGSAPDPLHLAVMLAFALAAGLLAARLFRWE